MLGDVRVRRGRRIGVDSLVFHRRDHELDATFLVHVPILRQRLSVLEFLFWPRERVKPLLKDNLDIWNHLLCLRVS